MLKVPSELGRVRLLPAAWLQTGKMRPSGWQKASTRGMLLQLLCITCLIAAARAGVDSQGQDWGVLTKSRAELGLVPTMPSQPILEPSKECAYLDAHCGICADNTCQGCSFPFQLNQSGKCECQEGHVLSDDGLTCVDSIAVALGRGIYTNPIVQGASNHTQAALDTAGKAAQASAARADQHVASFVGKQTQQLLPPGVKLPVAPDPLQSFLAAVGAPALQPEPDAPAPEQAPGAAVSGAPSVMPTAAAAAPERQLPGGFPDPLSLPGAGSLFPDIFAEAPALPVAAKVPKAPAPIKSLQHKPASDSLLPDIFGAGKGGSSFLSDLLAVAPVAAAPAQVPKAPAPTKSLQHKPASDSLIPDIFGTSGQPGGSSFLSDLFAVAPVAAAPAQAPAAHAPSTSLEQQPLLPPITSLLDQGNALLPSWLPKLVGRRLLRERMQL